MGVDLTLMPVLFDGQWLCHELIRVERRRDLWEPICELPQTQIPEPIRCFVAQDPKTGETYYGERDTDPYGCAMKYTTAGDLLTVKDHEGVQDNFRNRAAWAYLAQLPAHWPIVLYWH